MSTHSIKFHWFPGQFFLFRFKNQYLKMCLIAVNFSWFFFWYIAILTIGKYLLMFVFVQSIFFVAILIIQLCRSWIKMQFNFNLVKQKPIIVLIFMFTNLWDMLNTIWWWWWWWLWQNLWTIQLLKTKKGFP